MPLLCTARSVHTTCSSETSETGEWVFGERMLQPKKGRLAASTHMSTLAEQRSIASDSTHRSSSRSSSSSSSNNNSDVLIGDKTPVWKQLMKGYDHMQLPDAHGEAIRVNVSLQLEALTNVDEIKLTYKIHGYLVLTWRDPRLKVTNSTEAHPLSFPSAHSHDFNIWTPSISVSEAIDIKFYSSGESVDLYDDGVVRWSRQVSAEIRCPSFDFGKLPFDVQTCGLTIVDYFLDENHLVTSESPGGGILSFRALDSEEWKVSIKPASIGTTEDYGGRNFSIVTGCLQFKRSSQLYGTTLTAASMLVLASYTGFWIPASAAPARTGLACICFLIVMTNLQAVQNQLPHFMFDQRVWLNDFLKGSAMFCFSTLIEFALVSHGLAAAAKKKGAAEVEARNRNAAAAPADGANAPHGAHVSCKSSEAWFDASSLADLDGLFRYLYPVLYLIFSSGMIAVHPYYSYAEGCKL